MSISYQAIEEQLRKSNGFIDPREYQGQRHEKLEAARRILDKADGEKRALTTSESREERSMVDEARKLADIVARIESHNDAYRDVALREMNGGMATGRTLRDTQTGREIRAVRHGESFRLALGVPESSVRIGGLIRRIATGDWAGATEEERSYSQSAGAGGGYMLAPAMQAQYIDLARPKSVVSVAGTQYLPVTTEETRFAVLESDPTAGWYLENQEIDESTGVFGAFIARPKCLAIYMKMSLELLRNAPNAESIIEESAAASMALALDAAALNGNGSVATPMGMLYSPQTGTYAVNGPISHDKLLLASRQLWRLNREPTSLIFDANVRADYEMQKDGESRYQPEPPTLAKLGKYVSTQISSTTGSTSYNAYLGSFENTFFAVRSGIEIQVSGTADDTFRKKQVALRLMMFVDFCQARANDIVRLKNINLVST